MNLSNDPRLSSSIEITIPFHDVDSMGVVWHGNYFRYLEIAREALLKQFDYGYRQMEESGYAWPVIDTRVKYIGAVKFEQKITVHANLEEYENRIKINYKIVDENNKRLTTGYTIQVAVNMENGEMCFASPPCVIREAWSGAMIRLLSLLFFTLFSGYSLSAITLEELQQRSARNTTIRAQFEQTRQISGLSQSLKSSGEVLISQQHGLWWNQKKPFSLTLLLTENKMVETMNGQTPKIITAESNPQMFQFNHLLTALFKADRAVLEKNFSMDLQDLSLQTNNQGSWMLVLTPKTTPLDKLFKQITLTGNEFLESIEINDMQNDKSHIRFFAHSTTPKQLTIDETRKFTQ